MPSSANPSIRILAAAVSAIMLSPAWTPARAAAVPPDCRTAVKAVDAIAGRPVTTPLDDAASGQLEEAKGDFQQCQTQSADRRIVGLGFTGSMYVDFVIAADASRRAAASAKRGTRGNENFQEARDAAIASLVLIDTEGSLGDDLSLGRDDLAWIGRLRARAHHRLSEIYKLNGTTASAELADIDLERRAQSRPPHWTDAR